jgi:hypothetical protein
VRGEEKLPLLPEVEPVVEEPEITGAKWIRMEKNGED